MTLLPWYSPYDPQWIFGFLRARAVAGIETFSEERYTRSFSLAGHRGLITVEPDLAAQGLRVTLSDGLLPVADACHDRVARLFDLACDPRQVARTLGDLPQARPGLRLPGALDAFEQEVRRLLAGLGERVAVVVGTSTSGIAEAEVIGIGAAPRGDSNDRPLLQHLVSGGEIIGREPLSAARERHASARAQLPSEAFKMSKGYPAILTTVLDAEGEQTFNPYAPQG